MTRDEAIKLYQKHFNGGVGGYDGRAIDVFVALGMLKLDEPKSVNKRAWEVLRAFTDDACVIDCLHRAGLKIVEK